MGVALATSRTSVRGGTARLALLRHLHEVRKKQPNDGA